VTSTVDDAYRVCESVTREQARNFHYGIRLLPPPRRRALCALYALARRIDDIGDGDLAPPDRAAALAQVRHDLHHLAESGDPVLVAVADAARRYPVPLPAFDELVAGVEMDLTGRRYDSFTDLIGYCRCVAGSVGRLCLGIFGSSTPDGGDAPGTAAEILGTAAAPGYADALGIALQQTNILRDLREDLVAGRVYLPRQELDGYGVQLVLDDQGALSDVDGRLAAFIQAYAARTRHWYAFGLRLMPLLDRRSAACASAMAGIYRQLLERIAADPPSVYGQRLSLTGWQKAGVAARAVIGASA
jgi:15-cis-phytoene synthase